jgi:ankyrin repeat protein
VAIFGILLQFGALIFSGFTVYHPQFSSRFPKNGQPVPSYAFPTMAVGTVILVLGMLICSAVVEQSTEEKEFVAPGEDEALRARVLWLQRSHVVSDQNFDAFAIFRRYTCGSPRYSHVDRILTSRRAARGNPNDIDSSRKKAGLPGLGLVYSNTMEFLTLLGAFLGLSGFVLQFEGLRGMNWSASIAQLVCIGLMTTLRAWIRRGLIAEPVSFQLLDQHELDWLAFTFTKNDTDDGFWPTDEKANQSDNEGQHTRDTWAIMTGGPQDEECTLQYYPEDEKKEMLKSKADIVVRVRERLGHLSKWSGIVSSPATSLANAIEEVMNTLPIPASEGQKELTWSIPARTSETPGKIYFNLQKVDDRWVANAVELEAALSLWRYTYTLPGSYTGPIGHKDTERTYPSDWLRQGNEAVKKSIRLLGPNDHHTRRNIRWYVASGLETVLEVEELGSKETSSAGDRGSDTVNSTEITIDSHRIFGFTGNQASVRDNPATTFRVQPLRSERSDESDDTQAQQQGSHDEKTGTEQKSRPKSYLAVIVDTPLELLLAQDMFSAFMSTISGVSLGGETTIRQTDPAMWKSVRLNNTTLSKLANDIRRTGLCHDDAYLSIVPPLGNLPKPECLVEYARGIAKKHEAIGSWQEASDVYLWMFRICTKSNPTNPVATKATAVFFDFCRTVAENAEMWNQTCREPEEIEKINRLKTALIQEQTRADQRVLQSLEVLHSILRPADGVISMSGDPQTRDSGFDHHTETSRSLRKITGFIDGTELHQKVLSSLNNGYSWKVPPFMMQNLNAKDLVGLTPLHYAVLTKKHYIVQGLLHAGADSTIADISGSLPLHYAAVCYHPRVWDRIKDSLSQAAIRTRDLRGWTPLHYAAWGGYEDLCWVLLKGGASLEDQARDGTSVLHCAAKTGHKDTTAFLLEAGANVHTQDCTRKTPLHWASYHGNQAVIALLMDRGANSTVRDDDGRIPLHLAAAAGKVEKATFELLSDAKKTVVGSKDRRGLTPLHLATMTGQNEAVSQLLEEGTDIQAMDRQKNTPLHYAAKTGHTQTVHLLLDRGASIEAQDDYKRTPLHRAAEHGKKDTVQLLLDLGASIEAQDNYKETPLHCAAEYGKKDTVQLLLDRGASTEAQDDDKKTPLHRAAEYGKKDTVQLLLDRGASTEAQDDDKKTPLHCAALCGYKDTVQLLLDRGASTEAQDDDKETPLHRAAEYGKKDTVQLLLDRGASFEAQDDHKKTPLHHAAEGGHQDTVQLLLDRGASIDTQDSANRMPLDLATEKKASEYVAQELGETRKLDVSSPIKGQLT